MESNRVLSPDAVARLRQFRLATRRRVQGQYAGGHASRRFGSSLDFADYREYVPGDDPRTVDRSAYQRLGKLLVKLFEAEDEAAIRVVVDLSASMSFGRKAASAREAAAAFTAIASNGQDRVRVLLAGRGVDAGPWFRGPSALPAVESRLLAAAPDTTIDEGEERDRPDLVTALRRAHGEGPRGPVVLVSDLLFDGWDEVVRVLASGRGDAVLVHLLGRADLEPEVRGDVRLVDSETGVSVEVGVEQDALDVYAEVRDEWLDDVAETCGRHGVDYARLVDDDSIDEVVLTTLRRLGVVG